MPELILKLAEQYTQKLKEQGLREKDKEYKLLMEGFEEGVTATLEALDKD